MKVKKSILSIMSILAINFIFLANNSSAAYAQTITPVNVIINGVQLQQQPISLKYDGVPFVFFETLAEALGADADAYVWGADDKSMTIVIGDTRLIMCVGSPFISVSKYENGAFVFAQNYTMPVEPVIVDDYALIPLEYVAEVLGAEYSWDMFTDTAIVKLLPFSSDKEANINITFNNIEITTEAPVIERYGYIFFPLKEMLTHFGADYAWRGESSSAVGIRGKNKVEIRLSDQVYIVNGNVLSAPAELAPFIKDDIAYVYLDYVIDGLDLSAKWDDATKTMAIKSTRGGTYSSNLNNQDYTGYASSPVYSYLIKNGDSTFTRLEYVYDRIVLETFDAEFTCLSTSEIKMELPIFGGFYSGRDYNFIVYGQNNPDQNNALEVFKVVKYNKNWDKLGEAGLTNCNTTIPFRAGSLRMTEYGNMLYVRSCHQMYKSSDGLNHQSNITFSVSIPAMRITDSFSSVANISMGYVSHSFNQFILTAGSTIAAVDHGDAYPRSIVLTMYNEPAGSEKFTGGVDYVEVMNLAGETGANTTRASVGGFEISDLNYLVAGNSILQDSNYQNRSTRNIFIGTVPMNSPTGAGAQIKWLTNHAENGEVTTSTPHLVKIDNNNFMIMWTEDNVVKYILTDGTGAAKSEIKSVKAGLSDCKPIVDNGKVIWYTTQNFEPVFYQIPIW